MTTNRSMLSRIIKGDLRTPKYKMRVEEDKKKKRNKYSSRKTKGKR